MSALSEQTHWHVDRDSDNIVWLTLDKQNASTNTLDGHVLEELHSILQNFQSGKLPAGLVIQSGKKNGFIAGADIEQFKNLENTDAVFNLIRRGQVVFNILANLPFPTVALISGFCLGGGLELSLACRYRVAVIDPKTRLGLPEVNLGIIPGWGGTVRLPRLIGALKAMDLILSGRTVDAKTAFKMGIVDAAVPKRQCLMAVRFYIQKHPVPRKPTLIERLPSLAMLRPLFGKFFRRKLNARITQAHYPAPFAVVEDWVESGESDFGFIAEAKSNAKLVVHDTARNLIRVYYLQEKLKDLGRGTHYVPLHVHVVGAGVMGGDIAAWCVLKGIRVTLQDSNSLAIATALKRALVLFKKILKEHNLIIAAMDRMMPDKEGIGIKQADLIIEAIVEKKEAKQALFKQLEQEARSDALLATNTSTIPLNEIGEHLKNPRRIIGLHFFNPVAKMPLVEVISTPDSDPVYVQKGIAFVRSIEKFPLMVKSSPGFLVNRILMPYLLESMLLVEEGVPPQSIDKAARDFGMPMGPIELADTVGLDVCLLATEHLSQFLKGTLPSKIRQLVEKGNLGKKTGQGYYQYKNGAPIKQKLDPNYRAPEDLTDRLILRMLNESVAALREKVVSDADYLDAGMIFGTGFPPFRGGPMHDVAKEGKALILQKLNLLAQRYGDRFSPDKGWEK